MFNRALKIAISLFLLISSSSFTFNYSLIDDTDMLKQGSYDISFGGVFSKSSIGSSSFFYTNPRIGITDDFNISLNIPFGTVSSNGGGSGLGDISISGKYLLTDREYEPFHMAVIGAVKFATGDDKKHLGTGNTDFKVGLAFGKNFFNDRLTLNTNVGLYRSGGFYSNGIYRRVDNVDDGLGLFYGVNGNLHLNNWSSIFGGISGTTIPNAYGDKLYYHLGAEFKLSEKASLMVMMSNNGYYHW